MCVCIYIYKTCVLPYYIQCDMHVTLIKMLFSVHWQNMGYMPEQQSTVKISGRWLRLGAHSDVAFHIIENFFTETDVFLIGK